MKILKSNNMFFLTVIILYAILTLPRIGDNVLWLDESIFTTLSKNVLTYGRPIAYDGKNLISFFNGALLNDELVWVHHPPGYFYTLASFIKIIHSDRNAARILSVIFGFGTLILTYLLVEAVKLDRIIAKITIISLLLSVQYILICRDGTMYCMAVFLAIASLLAYCKMGENNRIFYKIIYLFSSIIMLYTMYIYAFPVIGTQLLHFLLFRRKNKDHFILFATIFIFMFIEFKGIINRGYTYNGITHIMGYVWHSFWKINIYYYPILIVGTLYFLLTSLKYRFKLDYTLYFSQILVSFKTKKDVYVLVLLIPVSLLMIPIMVRPFHLRYSLFLFPVLMIIGMFISMRILSLQKHLGILVIVIVIMTNILNIAPYLLVTQTIGWNKWTEKIFPSVTRCFTETGDNGITQHNEFIASQIKIRVFLIDYIDELLNGYKGPMDCLIQYLVSNKAVGKATFFGISYVPIVFHTRLEVKNIVRTEIYDYIHAPVNLKRIEKIKILTECPFDQLSWIIFYNEPWSSPEEREAHKYVEKHSSELVKDTIKVPNLIFNRSPDIYEHTFRKNSKWRTVDIYRKNGIG